MLNGQFKDTQIWDSFTDNVMTWNEAYDLAAGGADDPNSTHPAHHFVYRIHFADNLVTCQNPASYVFHVCALPGSPSYYLTTSQDCSGATIPAINLPGGADHNVTTFIPNSACCDPCSLETTTVMNNPATGNSCSGYGDNNGVIEVTTTNPAWTSITNTGDPWGSGSLYTYNLTLSNGASITQTMPPTGGNTATQVNCVTNTTGGTEHQVTCPSSSLIVPWMQVSGAGIPTGTYVGQILAGNAGSNVTQFTLIDAVGGIVLATAAATVTLTFSAGFRYYFGSLAPNTGALAGTHYILKVTDESGCITETLLVICEDPAPEGCTDNTAINYDATIASANDDGSCLFCDAVTGQLENATGVDIGDLFLSPITTVQDATVNSSNVPQNDGIISAQATLDPALQTYVSLGATETYTMVLYPVTVAGDPTTIGAATATQAGISSVTFNYTPQHSFTGLGYGHYAIKLSFVDSNNALEVEECFTWLFATVKVPVCDDPTNTNYNTTVPIDFRIPDASLCFSECEPCCSDSALITDPLMVNNGNPGWLAGQSNPGMACMDQTEGWTNFTFLASECNPSFQFSFECNSIDGVAVNNYPFAPLLPGSMTTVVLLFNGVPINDPAQHLGAGGSAPYGNIGSNGIPSNGGGIGSAHGGLGVVGAMGPTGNTFTSWGSGVYTWEFWYTLASGETCVVSTSVTYTQTGIFGCFDPAALNYNPATTCPVPCIYESWECDINTGLCFDPQDGTGSYATQADCIQNCIPPPKDGCTDPCAVNYDAAATTDDGSCKYKACLDIAATNYQFSCDCGIDIPTATINDPNCCIYPCQDLPDITLTTTNASGTCTPGGSNSDGCIIFTQTNTNGATLYDVQLIDSSGTILYEHFTANSQYIASGTTFTYCLLPAGVYQIITVDNLGCEYSEVFAIGLDVPGAGCTDPLASNYDPTATCDDGSCIYEGCTNPLAWNYNPNAIQDDGTCQFINEKNPCIPKKLKKAIVKLKACLSQKGSNWLAEYKVGTNVDCSTMNKWKLILLGYALKASKSENGFGLGCLFNCADKGTPDIDDVILNCSDLWVTGAAFTGLNDAATNGANVVGTSWTAGEGTTVTDPNLYFTSPHKLSLGDVIKMPSGLIWKVVSVSFNQIGPFTFDLKDNNPETATGITGGNWMQCVDSNFIDITTTVNYYDNFLKFVNKYCKDCKIPSAWQQIQ